MHEYEIRTIIYRFRCRKHSKEVLTKMIIIEWPSEFQITLLPKNFFVVTFSDIVDRDYVMKYRGSWFLG